MFIIEKSRFRLPQIIHQKSESCLYFLASSTTDSFELLVLLPPLYSTSRRPPPTSLKISSSIHSWWS